MNHHSGEYAQPRITTLVAQVPVINGYSTLRMAANNGVATSASLGDQQLTVILENTGASQVTLQLLEMDVYDPTASPARSATNLGASKVVKAGGRVTYTVNPTKRYIELKCTAGGPSNVRMQVTGQIEYYQLGFDKVRDNTIYPKELWQASIPAFANL